MKETLYDKTKNMLLSLHWNLKELENKPNEKSFFLPTCADWEVTFKEVRDQDTILVDIQIIEWEKEDLFENIMEWNDMEISNYAELFEFLAAFIIIGE